jgi:rod shape-determining protein MreC
MFSKKMVLVIVLIVLFSVSVLILALSSRPTLVAVRSGRVSISLIAPFQKAIVYTVGFFQDTWEHYFFLISVAEENKELHRYMSEAKALEYKYAEIIQENRRLRDMLALKQEMDQPLIAAVVISKDPSPWFQTILVDKGRSHGVAKGMPVITPKGIVGLVVSAVGSYSKVMLITDPNSAVDAVVQNNRARGIIKGGTSGYCMFDFVLRKHDVSVGEAVVTSGMDGVFPKGLPVGAVTDIVKYESGIFQEVTVTPFVDFERLEEVLIVAPSEPADPESTEPAPIAPEFADPGSVDPS